MFLCGELQNIWQKDPTRQGDFGGSKEKIKHIVTGKGRHASLYVANNLGVFQQQGNPLFAIRDKFPTVHEATRGFLDSYRSSLVLLGGSSTGTGFHLDWSEAYNIAFAVNTSDTASVLAVWVFISPSAVTKADEWLRGSGFPSGFATPGRVRLDDDRIAALKGYLGPSDIVIIEQRAGGRVYVPPGWVHQVSNLRPCLKLAWDLLDICHLPQYAMLQRRIAAPVFGAMMAADYMCANWLVEALLKKM